MKLEAKSGGRDGEREGTTMYPSVTNERSEAYYQRILRETIAFEKQLPELLNQFNGQYVAIQGQQVVGHDKDKGNLIRRTRQNHPGKLAIFRYVGKQSKAVVHMDINS